MHLCEEIRMTGTVYVIYSTLFEPKGALQMHSFQMTITNVNNIKVVTQINRQRPKYLFDAYAYEFMVINHMNLGSYSPLVWLYMTFVSIQKPPMNNIKVLVPLFLYLNKTLSISLELLYKSKNIFD
jgi:hypothetical protein